VLHHPGGEASGGKLLGGRSRRILQQRFGRALAQIQPEAAHPQFIGQGPDGIQDRAHRVPEFAHRIGHAMELPSEADQGAGIERLEIQLLEIQALPALGVSLQKHLESPVEQKPFESVGAHAPPDLIGGFEQDHRLTGLDQVLRTRQPSQPAAHDQGVHLSHRPPLSGLANPASLGWRKGERLEGPLRT